MIRLEAFEEWKVAFFRKKRDERFGQAFLNDHNFPPNGPLFYEQDDKKAEAIIRNSLIKYE